MEKYLEIFDVLYEIKEQISDKNYLFLNEMIKELYEKANQKNEVKSITIPIYYNSSVSDSESDSILTDSYTDNDSDIDLINNILEVEGEDSYVSSE